MTTKRKKYKAYNDFLLPDYIYKKMRYEASLYSNYKKELKNLQNSRFSLYINTYDEIVVNKIDLEKRINIIEKCKLTLKREYREAVFESFTTDKTDTEILLKYDLPETSYKVEKRKFIYFLAAEHGLNFHKHS